MRSSDLRWLLSMLKESLGRVLEESVAVMVVVLDLGRLKAVLSALYSGKLFRGCVCFGVIKDTALELIWRTA